MKIHRRIFQEQKEIFAGFDIQRIIQDFKKKIDRIFAEEKPDQKTLLLLRKAYSGNIKIIPPTLTLKEEMDKLHKKIDGIPGIMKNMLIETTKEKPSYSVKLYISKNGDFYRDPREQSCYKMDLGGRRIKVLKMLTHRPMSTKQILNNLGEDNVTNLYRTIHELNEKAVKDLDLVEKIIEFDGSIGYKINPIYDIIKLKK